MRRFLVLCAILCIHKLAFGQKIFQAGNYGNQKQKNYLEINGVLKEKYKNKGFYWFSLQRKDDVCIVNVVDTAFYNKAMLGKEIALKDCFVLDSKQWKRK